MHKGIHDLEGMKMGDVMHRYGELPVGAPGGMMEMEAGCNCGCPGCGVDCGCACCQGVSDLEHCPKCGGGLLNAEDDGGCSCGEADMDDLDMEQPVVMLSLGESYCAKCESSDGPCDECNYMDEKSCSECGSFVEEEVCTECGAMYTMAEAKRRKKKKAKHQKHKSKKGPSKKTAKKILKGTKTFAAKMKKVSGWAENPPAAAAWMMHKATGKWPREK